MNVPEPYEPRVPSDSMSEGRAALSVTWAALPFLSLGFLTPFTFGAALLWRRTAHLLVSTAVYGTVFALMVLTGTLLGPFTFLLSIVGCAHAFLIRRQVFDPDGLAGVGNDVVVERVRRQRVLRDKARELAASDPRLARELRIGRPDLPRQYKDGGLIDVNHAPAEVLTLLPGVTAELAERIARVRAETGGFMSAEEMAAVVALPPAITEDVAEYGLFLR
ncbi:Helix-hairpin-helix motif protein [Actinomadura rubteroloni]|uniref:Helix-hairpin-helix motif protein n=1 Tax=Actinomadura rubteroloni TaxID=1926885 RepID=A0A2P4UGK4_9ACTN|nr:helix-hairpin-helix domain-containing protein [Actinomadura rubteroloni]POM24204.1 Helix-hairpin-helix motif protein [Actinomadura rubteroloni]